MSTFNLTIVTPDGCKFDGEVTSVNVRSTQGAVQILAHHENYVTSLGMGPAYIGLVDGNKLGCCIGGMLSMTNNVARLIATSFEWADEIDIERAKRSLDKAEEALLDKVISDTDKAIAKAARNRALVRISCYEANK